MNLGERLKEQRLRTKLTAGQIAVALGFSDVFIYQLESGVKKPSLDTLMRLARRYKTSTDYLLGLTDDPSPSSSPDDETALTPEQQKLMQETLDELAALSPRDQRTVLELMRSMRKIEEEESGTVEPRIIGVEQDADRTGP